MDPFLAIFILIIFIIIVIACYNDTDNTNSTRNNYYTETEPNKSTYEDSFDKFSKDVFGNTTSENTFNSNNLEDEYEKLNLSEKDLAEFALLCIKNNYTQNLFNLIPFLNDKIENDFIKIFNLKPDFDKDPNMLAFTIVQSSIVYSNAYNFLIFIATKIYNVPIYKSVVLPFLSSEVKRLELQNKIEESVELMKNLYISSFASCLENLALSFSKISKSILNDISNKNSSSISEQDLKSIMENVKFYSQNYHTLLIGTAACFGNVTEREIDELKKIIE